jgi:hypothetical protein
VREEEEDRPLLKERKRKRKRGGWWVPLGLPMEPSGLRGYPVRGLGCSRRGEPSVCVSTAVLKPRCSDACVAESLRA